MIVLNKWRSLRNAEIAANGLKMHGQGDGDAVDSETGTGREGEAKGDEEKVAALYKAGMNIRQISAKLPGVPRETILQVIRESK